MVRIINFIFAKIFFFFLVTSVVIAETNEENQKKSELSKIIVFGGTRGTGLEIIKILSERGDNVTAFVRPSSNVESLEELGIKLLIGDAMNPSSVSSALSSDNFTGVISSLGSRRGKGRVDDIGTINVANATLASNIKRLLMVSSIGAGDSIKAIPFYVRWILGESLERKTTAEIYIQSTDLDYTIIRPGGLEDGPATGTGFLTEDQDAFIFTRIPRAEVASLLVEALDSPDSSRKIYHALPYQE